MAARWWWLAGVLALAWPLRTVAAETFSHADWTAVLQRFVDDQGRVDYHGLAADRAVFDRYLAKVESISPENRPELFPTREDQLAYYLNAYNALVFNGVLARGPEEESVWSGLISGFNFFSRMEITVGGKVTNLKQLEDDVVRARFGDPRVHAALNCASVGCPRLPREAFEPATLDAQLQSAMTEFVNNPLNCKVDEASRTVTLSKIFDWFSADFLDYERRQGTAQPVVLDYVNRFRASDQRIPRDFKVQFSPYDKRLNKQ